MNLVSDETKKNKQNTQVLHRRTTRLKERKKTFEKVSAWQSREIFIHNEKLSEHVNEGSKLMLIQVQH